MIGEQALRITDVCILVADIQRTVDFYTGVLGFRLRRRADGFADFHSEAVTLAAWELGHMAAHVGIANIPAPPRAHKACIAARLDKPADIDAAYDRLRAQGVVFAGPPADHPWNARCAYFTDPDDHVWELYAWYPDGPRHDFDSGASA